MSEHEPAQTTIINQPDQALGLSGPWKIAANFGGAVIIAGIALSLLWVIVHDGRAERIEDRQIFRETLHRLDDENNRRTGEIKGALDKNTEVMRDLINELKARRTGSIQPKESPPLKPIG